MIVKEIQSIARSMGLKTAKLNKTQLVRLIQKTEANDECFATPTVLTCGQDDCIWRVDCKKANK
ncbi:MAG: SAP domain-containing protein [Gammaproteobacteria bacterium]|nr:SAP domain-containing protein [Gammaproteobacteria bacterium]